MESWCGINGVDDRLLVARILLREPRALRQPACRA
jgi:hypothetical protein